MTGALTEMVQGRIEESRTSRSDRGDQDADSPFEGDGLPEVRLADAKGRIWTDEDWAGKVPMVNFWATWCAPCIKELPHFDEALAEYGDSGLAIVAISVDREGWDAERPFVEEHKPAHTVLVADDSNPGGFGTDNRLPTTFFVRKDGTIDSKRVGSMPKPLLESEVESLLRKDGLLAKQ